MTLRGRSQQHDRDEKMIEQPAILRPENEWRHWMRSDREGDYTSCLANAVTVFCRHPSWEGVLRLDRAGRVIKVKPPPTREPEGPSKNGEWRHADTTRAIAWCASNAHVDLLPWQVDRAIFVAAERWSE